MSGSEPYNKTVAYWNEFQMSILTIRQQDTEQLSITIKVIIYKNWSERRELKWGRILVSSYF